MTVSTHKWKINIREIALNLLITKGLWAFDVNFLED